MIRVRDRGEGLGIRVRNRDKGLGIKDSYKG